MPAAPAPSWQQRPQWAAPGAWEQAGRRRAHAAGGQALLDPAAGLSAWQPCSSASTSSLPAAATSHVPWLPLALSRRPGAADGSSTSRCAAPLPTRASGRFARVKAAAAAHSAPSRRGQQVFSATSAGCRSLGMRHSCGGPALAQPTISTHASTRLQVRVCNATPVLRLAAQTQPVKLSSSPAGQADGAATGEGCGSAAPSAAGSAQPAGTAEERPAAE